MGPISSNRINPVAIKLIMGQNTLFCFATASSSGMQSFNSFKPGSYDQSTSIIDYLDRDWKKQIFPSGINPI
jgi:hypothetical protein